MLKGTLILKNDSGSQISIDFERLIKEQKTPYIRYGRLVVQVGQIIISYHEYMMTVGRVSKIDDYKIWKEKGFNYKFQIKDHKIIKIQRLGESTWANPATIIGIVSNDLMTVNNRHYR